MSSSSAANDSSAAAAQGVGRSSQDSWRKNSPSQQTMFKGLEQYKREANPDVYQKRRESLGESKANKQGVVGGIWESLTGRAK